MTDPLADLLKPSPAAVHKEMVEAVATALADRGLTADALGSIEKLRFSNGRYEAMHKDDNGDAVVTTLHRNGVNLVFTPSWDSGPAWPVVQQARPVVVKVPKAPKHQRTDGRRTCVTLPDAQYPYHDPAAIDAAIRVIEAVRPDVVVWHGDNLDLSEFSRFVLEPRFAGSTQVALDALHTDLARVAALVPEQHYLEGNHEARLAKHILANAAAAFGLRPANVPDAWPVLSIEHLLRLDALGVSYHAGYPAGAVWLNDHVRIIHGAKHRGSKHSTAAAYASSDLVSTIFGHIHRVDVAYRTMLTRNGPHNVMAASPGCLCLLDGTVPSVTGGFDSRGNTVPTVDLWQQGVGIVTYDDTRHSYEHVEIIRGEAFMRGRVV